MTATFGFYMSNDSESVQPMNFFSCDSPYYLETTHAGVDLLGLGVDTPQEDTVAAREGVERSERNVEARGRVVDSEHVDGHAVVGELPAGAALRRVPSRDHGGTADVGEIRQRTEGGEAYKCVRTRAGRWS